MARVCTAMQVSGSQQCYITAINQVHDSIYLATDRGVFAIQRDDSVFVPHISTAPAYREKSKLFLSRGLGDDLWVGGTSGTFRIGKKGIQGGYPPAYRVVLEPTGRISMVTAETISLSTDGGTTFSDDASYYKFTRGWDRMGDLALVPGDGYWLATSTGLVRTTANGDSRKYDMDLLADVEDLRLAVDGQGNAVLSKHDQLYLAHAGKLDSIPFPPGLENHQKYIDAMTTTSRGEVLVSNLDKLYRVEDSHLTLFDSVPDGEYPSSLFEDSAGVLWVGTAAMLYRRDKSGWTARNLAYQRFNNGSVRVWHNPSIPLASPGRMALVSEDRIWFSMDSALFEYRHDSVRALPTPFSGDPAGSLIRGISPIGPDDVYLVLSSGAVWHWNGQAWAHDSTHPKTPTSFGFIKDSSGQIWAYGFYPGLRKKTATGWSTLDSAAMVGAHWKITHQALAYKDGSLRLAVDAGFYKFQSNAWTEESNVYSYIRVGLGLDGKMFRLLNGNRIETWNGSTWETAVQLPTGTIASSGSIVATSNNEFWLNPGLSLQVFQNGKRFDVDILTGPLPGSPELMCALPDGRIAMLESGFFAIHEKFDATRDVVSVRPRTTTHAASRIGISAVGHLLQIHQAPGTISPMRLRAFSASGQRLSEQSFKPDPSGISTLNLGPSTKGLIYVQVLEGQTLIGSAKVFLWRQ